MTGVHSNADHGQARRSLVWRIGTPAMVLLSGALFATSAVNSDGTDLRPGRYSDLASVVEDDAKDYRELEQYRQQVSADVDRLTAGISDVAVTRARRQIGTLKDPAGLEPRSGTGVSITLSDSPDDVVDAGVVTARNDPNFKLNRLVVHQQDIQAVVNALWNGGATAVTIAGQRVVSTTGIKCEGNAVQLQGVPYPQPFVIQAVGNQTALSAALSADPLVAGYREDSADPQIAIGWSMTLEEHVEAPAFTGVIETKYAEPLVR